MTSDPPRSVAPRSMAPSSLRPRAAGSGLGILVNANAKRGGRRIAVELGRALPGARVRLTRSPAEIEDYLRSVLREGEAPLRCVLAAGGDGTAIGLVNALCKILPPDAPFPPIGLLPLGTGNAWAHANGALKLGLAVSQLRAVDGPLPTRHYDLVECEGILTPFAGCGWDAELLNDYKSQMEAAKGPSREIAKSVYGYLSALFTRTVPKTLINGQPQVLVENLGEDVHRLTSEGTVVPVAGAKRGSILYEGPASVAGCATCPEFGYQFRAYPFAERVPGFFNARIYAVSAARAVAAIPDLWRGTHPMPGMHDWFATAIRMTFSRPVPLQIAGDAVGMRQSVDYRIHPRSLRVVDWRAMS